MEMIKKVELKIEIISDIKGVRTLKYTNVIVETPVRVIDYKNLK